VLSEVIDDTARTIGAGCSRDCFSSAVQCPPRPVLQHLLLRLQAEAALAPASPSRM